MGEAPGGGRVVLLVGTRKGAFFAGSDPTRRRWTLRGPLISGTWAVYDLAYDPASGDVYAGAASNWYGPAVWRSADRGTTWTHSSEGLTYGDAGPPVAQVWCLAPVDGVLYAGVDPAGLFRSADAGRTWSHLPALRRHPLAPTWRETRAGLPLHAVVPDPGDTRRLWVAIGAGGTLETSDGGASWRSLPSPGGPGVHALARAPGPAPRLYQQSNRGVYRSDDGGETWRDVTAGLPSPFGFPLGTHPRDPDTLYVVPLDATGDRRVVPQGRLMVWRSRDGGATWEGLSRGLPPGPAHLSVLRAALATDTLDPAGVYCGTSTGQLYASADEGETWDVVAPYLPPILAVRAVVVAD